MIWWKILIAYLAFSAFVVWFLYRSKQRAQP
jgi:hypothetical protein